MLDPTATARLLALPSLREQAEREYASRQQIQVQDLAMQRAARLRGTEVEARLLADITRWQSQAWAVRRIGALVWQEEPDYVPALNQAELELERGKHTVCWVLGGKCYGHPLWNDSHIPGIGRMSRPEAIAAILLHLSERA